jgi:hypothetical protein
VFFFLIKSGLCYWIGTNIQCFFIPYLCGTMWHYNQYLVKACWKRYLHDCLSWAQCVQSLTPRARLSLFTPSAHLDFGLPWFTFHWVRLWIELFVVGLRVFWSCDQRSAICLSSWHLGHSGCQTLYRVCSCTFSCRYHFRFSSHLPLKYEQLILLSFGQHPRLTAVEQDYLNIPTSIETWLKNSE